ncbi:MAG: sigma-70 family RNA polymerase sigma factor [Desulfitobacterium hafniense]|nr:sigma-70 family RNA polymerase sigma factor [Desulfitobacterium hafniense]
MSTCINCVWEEFSLPLKRFIKKRVVNEHDAEDIFQEIYLKIHKNIGSVLDEDKIHAWIYRVARNTMTDYYRRNHNSLKSQILLKIWNAPLMRNCLQILK